MKTTRKVIAVILSLVVGFSAFGAVTAFALTESAAAADAEAYNAVARDYSDVMGSVSKEKATDYADDLNGLLLKIFEKVDLKSVIYTDQVATTIIRALGELLNNSIVNTMDAAGIQENYPEAYEYLFVTCGGGSWDAVDNAQVKWGITPGDREAFAKAIGYGSTNFGSLIIFAGSMGAFFGQEDVYSNGLAPLVESLHVGKMDAFNTAMALGNAGIMEYIASKVCDAIDALIADPVNYVTDVLPDLARTYPASVTSINTFASSLGASISLPDFNGLVAMLGEKIGLALPEIDVETLAGMGTASVVESGSAGGYRTQINGDKAVVFMAVVNYVKETLSVKDNQYALGRLIVEKTGYASTETYDSMVAAAKDDDTLLFISNLLGLVEEAAGNIGADESLSGFAQFLAKILEFFAKIQKFFVDLLLRLTR